MESKESKFKMKGIFRIGRISYGPSNPMPDKLAASYCLNNPLSAPKLFEKYPKNGEELKAYLEDKPKKGRPKKVKEEIKKDSE